MKGPELANTIVKQTRKRFEERKQTLPSSHTKNRQSPISLQDARGPQILEEWTLCCGHWLPTHIKDSYQITSHFPRVLGISSLKVATETGSWTLDNQIKTTQGKNPFPNISTG